MAHRPDLRIVPPPADYVRERPDLYASLAAVTLPDSGSISRRVRSASIAPSRGTVVRKATDLTIAFAINALLWATIAVCFLLLASGRL